MYIIKITFRVQASRFFVDKQTFTVEFIHENVNIVILQPQLLFMAFFHVTSNCQHHMISV